MNDKYICTNTRHLDMELDDYQLEICKQKNCEFIGKVTEHIIFSDKDEC